MTTVSDPVSLAALVGAASSLVGASAFWLRSRVRVAELREEQRLRAEADEHSDKRKAEQRILEERDAWKARAESAEQRERMLADELADVEELLRLGGPSPGCAYIVNEPRPKRKP